MANPKRTFSFDDDENDNHYFPSSQHQPGRSAGFQVSNPAAFLPDLSRQRSPSPVDSTASLSGSDGRRRIPQYESSIPMQERAKRMSAYRQDRQEDTAYRGGSPVRGMPMNTSRDVSVLAYITIRPQSLPNADITQSPTDFGNSHPSPAYPWVIYITNPRTLPYLP